MAAGACREPRCRSRPDRRTRRQRRRQSRRGRGIDRPRPGAPKLRLQSLVYPVGDYTLSGASYEKFAEGYGVLTRRSMEWFRDHYLRSPADAEDWRASPSKAARLDGVAPAIVVAAECDVLHDDGKAYAEALARAGVPVEYREYPGMIHGFFGMVPAVDAAMEAQRQVWAAFGRAFA